MISLGFFHFATSLVALASGAVVLGARKGTAFHRRLGWVYVAAMLATNGSALLLFRLTGRVGPFHVAALVSLVTVTAGIAAAVRRRPGWLDRHYWWMAYSYLGLLAAAVSETSTRTAVVQSAFGGPTPAFWTTVAVATALVMGIGSVVVRRNALRLTRPSPTDGPTRAA